MKRILSVLIPIIIAIVITMTINQSLDKQIKILSQTKNISLIGRNYGEPIKDKSAIIKRLLSNNGDLFLLGSSEMGINVPQNPLNFFPIKGANYWTSCFGRPYAQDLQQATYLGSDNINPNQKVTLIVSIQWFERQNAIEPNNFAVNFSDMQFYKFLENPKISEENKQYYAKRVSEFLTQSKKYPAEALYAKLYYNPTPIKNSLMVMFKPYYEIKKYLLEIKDKALIYEELNKLPNYNKNSETVDINWNDEYSKVKDHKSKMVSTNQFNVSDKYYNENLKNIMGKLKDESKDEDPINSEEMNDYQFFLSVCKELNIKPYIVMMPVNGWYYDYTGLTKDKRYKYYDKIKKMANSDNFDVLDLRENEYEKGFLIDPMHLGEEGWLNVSEGIYKHFLNS